MRHHAIYQYKPSTFSTFSSLFLTFLTFLQDQWPPQIPQVSPWLKVGTIATATGRHAESSSTSVPTGGTKQLVAGGDLADVEIPGADCGDLGLADL